MPSFVNFFFYHLLLKNKCHPMLCSTPFGKYWKCIPQEIGIKIASIYPTLDSNMTTLFKVFSVTYYLKLHRAITF